MFPFKHLKRALPVVALLTTAAFFTTPASAQVNPGGEKGGGSHGLTFNGKGQNGAGDTHGLNFTNSGKTDVPGQKNGEPIYMNKGKDGAGDTHRLNVNTGKIDPPNPDLGAKTGADARWSTPGLTRRQHAPRGRAAYFGMNGAGRSALPSSVQQTRYCDRGTPRQPAPYPFTSYCLLR